MNTHRAILNEAELPLFDLSPGGFVVVAAVFVCTFLVAAVVVAVVVVVVCEDLPRLSATLWFVRNLY